MLRRRSALVTAVAIIARREVPDEPPPSTKARCPFRSGDELDRYLRRYLQRCTTCCANNTSIECDTQEW